MPPSAELLLFDDLEREARGMPRIETAAQSLGRRDSYVFE